MRGIKITHPDSSREGNFMCTVVSNVAINVFINVGINVACNVFINVASYVVCNVVIAFNL